MSHMSQHTNEAQRVLLIAGLAGAEPRTVKRYLAGAHIKGADLRERLDSAARRVAELVKSSDQMAA